MFRIILNQPISKRGHTMTKQKAAVLEVVRSAKCHYTVEEIHRETKKILPGISLATVYNNLHALERDKQIRKITGEDGSDRYDSSFIPHGHLYCMECGVITDFEPRGLNKTLSEAAGGEYDSYELKVRYLCKKCKEAHGV